MYSNCIISSDLCQYSSASVLLILLTNPSCHYTLCLTALRSGFTRCKRKSPEVHSGWTDEKWDLLLFWWPDCLDCLVLYGCMVLLGGKIGRNWWRCPHSTPLHSPGPLLSSPLLCSTCSNTTPVSHDKLRPIQQTIIIHNVSHLTPLLTNICNTNQYFSHLRLCFLK